MFSSATAPQMLYPIPSINELFSNVTVAPVDISRAGPREAENTAQVEPAWKAAMAAASLRLLHLKSGWDGPGSVPLNRHLLRYATRLVDDALTDSRLAVAPYIVPGGDGSVQLEWHEPHGELEFDLGSGGEFTLWCKNHLTGAEFEGEDDKALALFYRWAAWVASPQLNADMVAAEAPDPHWQIAA